MSAALAPVPALLIRGRCHARCFRTRRSSRSNDRQTKAWLRKIARADRDIVVGCLSDVGTPIRWREVRATQNFLLSNGSVQKLVRSRGVCDSSIWTADGFELLSIAGTKCPVVNCAADLQHQIGTSLRPAHWYGLPPC